ncbi:hypothetical protein LO763_21850 [Glycomyces sp. A-F 0318]|uniref:hypothetical protein n=1 Tax=Glycomyces amatae TaxID=2881355 RepID=UPI001E5B77F8|nr:hypothetical protein [Glycomyces amatae]MCD0446260.1 hypothetical protein [Glycomyces amatae]
MTYVGPRRRVALALASAGTEFLAACGGEAPTRASPTTGPPSESAAPTDDPVAPTCGVLEDYLTVVDQMTDGTMLNVLEDLPADTAVSRALDSVDAVATFGGLAAMELPSDLLDEVGVISDAVTGYGEHLAAGGALDDVHDFTGTEEFGTARDTLEAYKSGDAGCAAA